MEVKNRSHESESHWERNDTAREQKGGEFVLAEDLEINLLA